MHVVVSLKSVVEVVDLVKVYPDTNHLLLPFWRALAKRNCQNKRSGFRALDKISFEVFEGDTIGVIGPNGAGKSTLLQILAGTLTPTSGKVSVQGSVGAILELGAGFHPDFTGRENAYLYGRSIGVSEILLERRIDIIIEFADLGEHIDWPIRTYSSGMLVRLAFSVASHLKADILLVDEALSVGDSRFQLKSFEYMKKLWQGGKTLFFCSHSMYHVQSVCSKAIYLADGVIKTMGDVQRVVRAYEDDIFAVEGSDELREVSTSARGAGMGDISSILVFVNGNPKNGDGINVESCADEMSVEIICNSCMEGKKYSIGIAIFDSRKMPVCSAATHFDGLDLTANEEGVASATVKFSSFPLLKGCYTADVFLMSGDGMVIFGHARDAFHFESRQSTMEVGLVHVPNEWNVAQQ